MYSGVSAPEPGPTIYGYLQELHLDLALVSQTIPFLAEGLNVFLLYQVHLSECQGRDMVSCGFKVFIAKAPPEKWYCIIAEHGEGWSKPIINNIYWDNWWGRRKAERLESCVMIENFLLRPFHTLKERGERPEHTQEKPYYRRLMQFPESLPPRLY